jgi:hypothetical protein
MTLHAERSLRKIHLRIYEEDYQAIKNELITDEAGINKLLRTVIHSFVTNARDDIRRAIDRAERPHNGG